MLDKAIEALRKVITLMSSDEIKSNFGDKKYVKALKNGFNSLLELNKKEEKK